MFAIYMLLTFCLAVVLQMGISQVGVRKRLLDGIRDLHKKEWDMSNVTQQLEILRYGDV